MEVDKIFKNLSQVIEADDSLRFLPDWQVRCLLPIALGRPYRAIALEVGRKESEIRAASTTILFKQALAIATNQAYQLSGELCAASSIEAVLYLKEIMGNQEARTCDRIRAAMAILDRADVSDRYKLDQRLKSIEAALTGSQ